MKTFKTMLKTELKLSLRGMDMFIFAICMPVVYWVLFMAINLLLLMLNILFCNNHSVQYLQ